VTGEQFVWIFTYSNGYTVFGNLTVPVNEIVILNITSVDVDHSFSIDSLSVAKDALPGEHNFVWFNATQTGFFKDDIRCKELCGIGHSGMIADFNVTSDAGFNAFLTSHNPAPPSTGTSSSGTPTGPISSVSIPQGAGTGANFSPAAITVASGTTIVWTDQDTSAIHNIVFTSVPSGATMPAASPNLSKGDTFQATLTTPGVYKYECQYHSGWMQGTITVTG